MPGHEAPPRTVYFAVFQKGGSTSFNNFLPKKSTYRFRFSDARVPPRDILFYLNEVGWGAADVMYTANMVWIMRNPVARAWSEWNYRSSSAEPTSLAKARRDDTWETYVTRHAEHHVRHVGPGATECYCGNEHCQGTRPRSNKLVFSCLWERQNEAQLQVNADAATVKLREAKVVGTLERIDEAMVLLWHAKVLDFMDQPCSLARSNRNRKQTDLPDDARQVIERLNPLDMALYNATVAEFERRVAAASENPDVARWMELARSNDLNPC